MKAIRIHQTGDLSVIQCDNVSAPKEIGPEDVLIKPEIAGVNCIDTYFRSGHFHVQLPFTLGQECGGKVARIGESVKDIQPGDYVVALAGSSFAERVVAPRSKVTKLPKELDTRTAVAAWLQGLTAVTLTHAAYQIKRGDYVLVHAAAGGTGLMLVQVAKALGAHVIGTTSTTEKAERAKTLGAEHVLLYKDDIVGRVNELTSGKGVNVVYDSVGKSTLDQSLEVLAQHGSLILFGESSGAPDPPASAPFKAKKYQVYVLCALWLPQYTGRIRAFQWHSIRLAGQRQGPRQCVARVLAQRRRRPASPTRAHEPYYYRQAADPHSTQSR